MADGVSPVVILTEGGGARGFGHVVRCGALAEAFRNAGHGVQTYVDCPGPLPESFGRDPGARRADWKGAVDVALPVGRTERPITVVDSYEADGDLLRLIADRSRTCCFFDDLGRTDYPSGLVVNPAFDIGSRYSVRQQGICYLTGPRYAVLREAFSRRAAYAVREQIERVLVALGSGLDSGKVKAIVSVVKRALPAATVTVIHDAGGARDRLGCGSGVRLEWALPPEEFRELALHCDLAVCAGGQVLLEMACLGVPTVSILTADNQRANIDGLQQAGFALSAGGLDDPEVACRVSGAMDLLKPRELRAKRSSAGRRLVDGNGARRVVLAIEEAGNRST